MSEVWLSPMLQMLLLLALIWEGYLCQIARYEVQKQPDVTVLEGMCARVPCNISSPLEHIPKVSPGYGYWFRKGKYKYDKLVATNDPNREIEAEVQVRFHLLGNPGMANCSLNIPKARKADSGQYYFWMKREGQVNSTHLKLLVYVNVTDAVQNVTITVALDNRTTGFVPGNSSVLVVQEGRSLHLLCAANSNPPATLSWILGDQTLISSQPSEDGVLHLDLPTWPSRWRQLHLPGSASSGLQAGLPKRLCAVLLCPEEQLLAPGAHSAPRSPHGCWLSPHLQPHLALLHQKAPKDSSSSPVVFVMALGLKPS
ncbi:sialic acid-binding Ig-like lectin 8 isoform X2 [Notamacropus eugenii]|uniref:sialic acid-binding Ig-like lectin 8 isoform X2 n=1 Tax=Notamacropus eugenii TaxID=9315 RepID=UPI003B67BE6E